MRLWILVLALLTACAGEGRDWAAETEDATYIVVEELSARLGVTLPPQDAPAVHWQEGVCKPEVFDGDSCECLEGVPGCKPGVLWHLRDGRIEIAVVKAARIHQSDYLHQMTHWALWYVSGDEDAEHGEDIWRQLYAVQAVLQDAGL